MQILRGSALYASTFDKKLQRMLKHNYSNPNFPTKHLMKDTHLFLTEAESLELDPSITIAVSHILAQTLKMGLAEADYAALFSAMTQESTQESTPNSPGG
jgi:3-hydroxyisobutyrate dehydrogenase-like beta-hydroxyacid dehydrogenase